MRKFIRTLTAVLLCSLTLNMPLSHACEEDNVLSTAIGKDVPSVEIIVREGKIAIYRQDERHALLQEISYSLPNDAKLAPGDLVTFEDMNFDGYMDLKIAASVGRANRYNDCWLWDKASGKFVLHEELSQLASLVFNPESKTVRSYAHISASDSEEATYTWENGKLSPIHRIERIAGKDGKKLIEKEYRSDAQGELRLVREQEVSSEEAMRNQYEDVSQHGFSLLAPPDAVITNVTDGVTIAAKELKWIAVVRNMGKAVDNLDNDAVREELEAEALRSAPFTNSQVEWAYGTATTKLNGYEFYRRPFTGTMDGRELSGGELYYANIHGKHIQVITIKLKGIQDSAILLYSMLYETLVID